MSVTFNPELVLSITIGKRAGAPETITARLGDFPQEAIDKFLTYGFQRVFNDAVGGADTPTADKVKAARDMVERFKKGEVGRTRGESVDPFMVIVLRVVKNRVKVKNPAKYKQYVDGPNADHMFKNVLQAAKENKPETYAAIMAEATLIRQQQEALANVRSEDIGLDDSDL